MISWFSIATSIPSRGNGFHPKGEKPVIAGAHVGKPETCPIGKDLGVDFSRGVFSCTSTSAAALPAATTIR